MRFVAIIITILAVALTEGIAQPVLDRRVV